MALRLPDPLPRSWSSCPKPTFGLELTFFRIALGPEPLDRGSDWATSQLYMGHFALTDVDDDQFYSFERFSRQALGLAGATFSEDQTFRVWLESWSAELDGSARPTVRLKAREKNIAIDLTLESAKPLMPPAPVTRATFPAQLPIYHAPSLIARRERPPRARLRRQAATRRIPASNPAQPLNSAFCVAGSLGSPIEVLLEIVV